MRRAIHERNILFLCEDNAQLSQMAEAAAKHLAPPKTRIFSAGIKPGRIPPAVIKAMNEIGIPMAEQKSKGLATCRSTKSIWSSASAMPTNNAPTCPAAPRSKAGRSLTRSNEKREGEDLDALREERDEIEKRVFALFMDYWRNVA